MTGRIPITDVHPVVSCGRYPAKAAVGETFEVSATVFREGHDAVACNVVLRDARGRKAPAWLPMRPLGQGSDRWAVDLRIDEPGRWSFAIEAWSDPWATWHHDAGIKVPAGIDVELMLTEGALVLDRAVKTPGRPGNDRGLLADAAARMRDRSHSLADRFGAASGHVDAALARLPVRDLLTSTERFPIFVDRRRALVGSWYEFFPRSEGARPDEDGVMRSGTFATAADRLPAVAAMGFDVVYVPPIHPIGLSNRKGPNNTLTPGPDDVGVPWAIGSADGGHDAIHPDLGDFDDFDAFVARTRELGMELAIDLALQASPDHPWATEHPEWFTTRADGTIAYAENPPKKYQDIYPLNFDNDPAGLYAEVLRIVRLWMSHGVRIFRVDNPHTKPLNFWEWLLAEVRKTDPDVLFLAEAFTRPPMMHGLGRVGYHQSYTYFTWRTSKAEITDYFTELSKETAHLMRPNFFVNTPDILHAYLQNGGQAAFKVRAVLASMASPTWGVYAGYELFEGLALRPGSEEYLDSEKYQLRPRDWAAADGEGRSLTPYLTRLNAIRRAHPALQELRNISFHRTDSESIIAFSKTLTLPDGSRDSVIVVVNLDPHAAHEDTVHLDMAALGLSPGQHLSVRDEINGQTYWWGEDNYVRLDPAVEPAHVLTTVRGA